MAFIASAETLLSAAAVDRMHSGQRSDFDKELSAQGRGQHALRWSARLPMTGVIVRSSANVQAGMPPTRLSAMFHGVWLLGFRAVAVERAAKHSGGESGGRAGVHRDPLVDVKAFRAWGRYGRMPMFTYAATALAIVFTDLLTGRAGGLWADVAETGVQGFARLNTSLIDLPQIGEMELRLSGAATFPESAGVNPGAVDGACRNHRACTAE